jgi:ribosomal protein S18 acetylase RimI-like enzyme
MAEFERLLEDLGCPKVNLQVRAGNERVITFYESLGYADDHTVSLGKRLIADD